MVSSINVANFLLRQAAREPQPESLTQLRLQKLLYYVQGWSLAVRGTPMFSGRIEAWTHGPVVKDVYRGFSSFEDQPITVTISEGSPPALDAEDAFFTAAVWQSYKQYSSTQLWEMTHNELPWKQTRAGLSPTAKCDREIPLSVMEEYFSQEFEQGRGMLFRGIPDWTIHPDPAFREAAQAIFLRNAQVLRRLA